MRVCLSVCLASRLLQLLRDLRLRLLARANPDPDRKFNIVVYGIMESPDGTPRQNKMAHDNQEVLHA